MRGFESNQEGLFSYVSPEARVPADHPLRAIRVYADEALRRMSRVFNQMYAEGGRLSVPPETLLKSTLLMALYSVRSERLFCEMLEYNLLFRWFLAMGIDDAAFDHSTFSKNRQRLLEHRVAPRFLGMIVRMARRKGLVSDEHFSVDGTLIDAWASMKSVRPKDGGDGGVGGGNPEVDFKGQRRRNDTHASTTDPQAQLARKGQGRESRLAYAGHALMENRNGLVLGLSVTAPNDNAEVKAAEALLDEQKRLGIEPDSLGADKGYCQRGFVEGLRGRGIKPHIARIEGRRLPGMDGRTTGSKSYAVSQRVRKRIEECFGWLRKLPRQVDSSEVELWVASSRSR
jgi:transposase